MQYLYSPELYLYYLQSYSYEGVEAKRIFKKQ